jgi:hypothetical protein
MSRKLGMPFKGTKGGDGRVEHVSGCGIEEAISGNRVLRHGEEISCKVQNRQGSANVLGASSQ